MREGRRSGRAAPTGPPVLLLLVALALPGSADASLRLQRHTSPAPCAASLETSAQEIDGPDAVQLPAVVLVTSCSGRSQPDRRLLLVADACVYAPDGRHLRPDPHDGPRRALPAGSQLASCLPAGGLWRLGDSYPARHRTSTILGPGRSLWFVPEEALPVHEGVIPGELSAELAPLERLWRAHLGAEPGPLPVPELYPGLPLPALLARWARGPAVEPVPPSMYQAPDGAWLGWTGPVVVGSGRIAGVECDVVSEGGRWRLQACDAGPPQGPQELDLELFGVQDPDPDAVFGLTGPARGLRAAVGEGVPVLALRGIPVEVAGPAAAVASPVVAESVVRTPVPLLNPSRLAGLAAVGSGLSLGGIGLMIVGRRRRSRGGPPTRSDPPARPQPEVPPPAVGPSGSSPTAARASGPPGGPPPPAESSPAPRIGGVAPVPHPAQDHLEEGGLMRAVLGVAGLDENALVELLPEVGAFQASYRVGTPEGWLSSVVAVYPHQVAAADEARHGARIGELVQLEAGLWQRADRLLARQRGGPDTPPAAGLSPVILSVRPAAWRSRVRPVELDAGGWSLKGLVRPHVPWPTLADEPQPEAAVADALRTLVAALVVTTRGLGPVVPAEQLTRELAVDHAHVSGTLRPHQLLVAEQPGGRLLVLPTQWRPLFVRARAAFVWGAP